MGKKGQTAKERYIVYKNKLPSILRKMEKQYFIYKLNGLKGKMKETWSVINSLTGRKSKKITLCEHVIKNNIKVKGDKDIADEFNEFYINVGKKPANDINCKKYKCYV